MKRNHEPEFSAIKKRAADFYASVIKTYCPALGLEVYFSSDGFHHLQFDGTRTERSKLVQRNKMNCLEEAVDIIKKTTTIQEYRSALQPIGKVNANGLRQTKYVTYYAFLAITDVAQSRRINVVIRRIGDGHYHFWSVMPSWKTDTTAHPNAKRNIGGGWLIDA